MTEKTDIDVHAYDVDGLEDEFSEQGLKDLENAHKTALAMQTIRNADGYPVFIEKLNAMRQVSLELGIFDKDKPNEWYQGYMAGWESMRSLVEDNQFDLNELTEELEYWKGVAKSQGRRRERTDSD
jgi:hypothetical protein